MRTGCAHVVMVGRSTDDAPNPVMSGTLEQVVSEVEATGAEVLGPAANLAAPRRCGGRRGARRGTVRLL